MVFVIGRTAQIGFSTIKTKLSQHNNPISQLPPSWDSLLNSCLLFQNWSLQIRSVHIDDAGEYLCQTSQHPPSSVMVRLAVTEAWADIVGSEEKVFRSVILRQKMDSQPRQLYI